MELFSEHGWSSDKLFGYAVIIIAALAVIVFRSVFSFICRCLSLEQIFG
ncbi:MAG: hypothetical protein HOC71_11580 [Candidatus Latescibacteria bacterium]|jgi:hypothetical protein|nr:hypothetical protein [Candidatus Latescibacterota bacterium]